MPSGGSRARSGPAPDPNALRRDRNTDAEWLTLPANGREGDPPTFPLIMQNEREAELWSELWAMPQAYAWEQRGLIYEVALFTRRLAEAEQPGSTTSIGTLVRQQMDSLGLTTPGMRSNRWRIAEDELAEARADRTPQFTSAKNRLKRVQGGG